MSRRPAGRPGNRTTHVHSFTHSLHSAGGQDAQALITTHTHSHIHSPHSAGLQDAQALITEEFKEPADLDALLAMTARLRAALRAVADDSEAKAAAREQSVSATLEPKLAVRPLLPALCVS